jgi:hypothetical protein
MTRYSTYNQMDTIKHITMSDPVFPDNPFTQLILDFKGNCLQSLAPNHFMAWGLGAISQRT